MHSTHFRAVTVIVAGYAAGCTWFGLHPDFPAATGSTELPTRALIAFLLPTAAAVLVWLFSAIESPRAAGVRDSGEIAATERILLRVVVFAGALHGLVILRLTEIVWIRPWAAQLAFVLLGVLLVSVGDLLPTTRPNFVVGIRTPRSLSSRDFWIAINRVGGYVAVGLGLVVIVAAGVLRHPLVGQVISAAALAAAAIVVARYRNLVRDSGR
jgi:hypothetical protein